MDQIIFNNHPNFPWKQTNGETMCKDFWAGGMNVKEENEVYEDLNLKRVERISSWWYASSKHEAWLEWIMERVLIPSAFFCGVLSFKIFETSPFFFSSFFIKREEAHLKFETQGWVHRLKSKVNDGLQAFGNI